MRERIGVALNWIFCYAPFNFQQKANICSHLVCSFVCYLFPVLMIAIHIILNFFCFFIQVSESGSKTKFRNKERKMKKMELTKPTQLSTTVLLFILFYFSIFFFIGWKNELERTVHCYYDSIYLQSAAWFLCNSLFVHRLHTGRRTNIAHINTNERLKKFNYIYGMNMCKRFFSFG